VRVLTVASEFPPVRSGVASTVSRVVEGLRERGFTVDVLHGGDAPYRQLGEFRFSALGRRFARFDALTHDYDLVHLHGPAPFISDALLVRAAARRPSRRPPILYTHHFCVELEGWRAANYLYNGFHRRIAAVADHVVVTTPSYAALLQLGGRVMPEVIPWAVDADQLAGGVAGRYRGGRPLRVLFVGQMRPYKGVGVLMEAVAGQAELEVTIAGGGPLLERYRARGATMPKPSPRFLGPVEFDRLRRLFMVHDIVVLPSINRLEAFGLVLLEGMAAGCVPVASDWPGVRDIAGPSGLLVRPKDPTALAGALLRLARDPETTAALQRRSIEVARSFRWEETIDRYARRMSRLLEGHPRAGDDRAQRPRGRIAFPSHNCAPMRSVVHSPERSDTVPREDDHDAAPIVS
jgi:glycosyltransferase involved in cell wall biosynthesis